MLTEIRQRFNTCSFIIGLLFLGMYLQATAQEINPIHSEELKLDIPVPIIDTKPDL